MFKFFQTTTIILIWTFVLSLLFAWLRYLVLVRKQKVSSSAIGSNLIVIPSLVTGPILLVIFYEVFKKNLIFPLHFFASITEIISAAFYPAAVLFVASGLLTTIFQSVDREYKHWSEMQFFLVVKGMGKNQSKALRKLVLLKSLTSSWSQCLPWLFGELIVVESVFNAPGLGLDAWHMARIRDFNRLIEIMFWLAILYGCCVLLSSLISKWIGKRLESYGG